MADLKWDAELKPWQRANPVVYHEHLVLPESVPTPLDSELEQVFRTSSFRLQTWNRAVDAAGKVILINDPHWIAVRGGTPLHYDPKYPRYSHHLKVRCDPGIICRGLSREELPLVRGLYYVLDAHSPHQVFHTQDKRSWNVAASIDSHEVLDHDSTIQILLDYVLRTPILTPDVLSR